MWHVRADQLAPAILLVVDFGGWYKLDSKASDGNTSHMIQHTQMSLLRDVIVPYTYLLPKLHLSENQRRHTLMYYKGAKHMHRGDNVPAPFMSFETTGFPPEILREILQEHVATLMQERRESSENINSQVRRSSDSRVSLPSICLVKNLRRKVVAMGRVNKDTAYCEDTYNIVLDGIYEENENLYDKDEKFGDIRIGDMINWPKKIIEFVPI